MAQERSLGQQQMNRVDKAQKGKAAFRIDYKVQSRHIHLSGIKGTEPNKENSQKSLKSSEFKATQSHSHEVGNKTLEKPSGTWKDQFNPSDYFCSRFPFEVMKLGKKKSYEEDRINNRKTVVKM